MLNMDIEEYVQQIFNALGTQNNQKISKKILLDAANHNHAFRQLISKQPQLQGLLKPKTFQRTFINIAKDTNHHIRRKSFVDFLSAQLNNNKPKSSTSKHSTSRTSSNNPQSYDFDHHQQQQQLSRTPSIQSLPRKITRVQQLDFENSLAPTRRITRLEHDDFEPQQSPQFAPKTKRPSQDSYLDSLDSYSSISREESPQFTRKSTNVQIRDNSPELLQRIRRLERQLEEQAGDLHYARQEAQSWRAKAMSIENYYRVENETLRSQFHIAKNETLKLLNQAVKNL